MSGNTGSGQGTSTGMLGGNQNSDGGIGMGWIGLLGLAGLLGLRRHHTTSASSANMNR
jgi:hypothetical protein